MAPDRLHRRYVRQMGGFSLLELLIALSILSIVLLALVGLAATAIQGNAFSQRLTTATTLAKDKLEGLQLAGYNGSITGTTTETETYSTIANFPLFKRETVIQANTPAAGMQTITVTVFWDNDEHSTSATVLLAE